MNSCTRPDRPTSDLDTLVAAWLRHCDSHDHAMNVEQYARHTPELGWASILAVLELPHARPYLSALEWPLRMLISQNGPSFIERIEIEAVTSSAFRECLGHVQPDPVFSIPESLWDRLTNAAGKPIGPMAPHMVALFADIPELAEALALDLDPLDPDEAPTLTTAELHEQAEGWVAYHETFWAWEELNRILVEEGEEATWSIVLAVVENASEHGLGRLGAGILETLLGEHGPAVIERVEALAAIDQRFRFCLSHAWQGDMSDEIWQRVVVARGDEPQRG